MKFDHKGHSIKLTQKGKEIIAEVTTKITLPAETSTNEAFEKAKHFIDRTLGNVKSTAVESAE